MARVTNGASGSALGKAGRAAASGLAAPGVDRQKGIEKAKPGAAVRPIRLPVRRLPRLWSTAVQFLSDVRAEMNRVAWPDRKTVIASTIVVVFVLVITALYLAGWDYIFAELFNVLFKR
jgi:preprotein translocase subunit SecE